MRRDRNFEITQLLHDGNRGGTSAAAWRRAGEVAWREKRAAVVSSLARAALRNALQWTWIDAGSRARARAEGPKGSANRRPGESYAAAYERKRRLKGLPPAVGQPR